jgi:hypothetical protein
MKIVDKNETHILYPVSFDLSRAVIDIIEQRGCYAYTLESPDCKSQTCPLVHNGGREKQKKIFIHLRDIF